MGSIVKGNFFRNEDIRGCPQKSRKTGKGENKIVRGSRKSEAKHISGLHSLYGEGRENV